MRFLGLIRVWETIQSSLAATIHRSFIISVGGFRKDQYSDESESNERLNKNSYFKENVAVNDEKITKNNLDCFSKVITFQT